MTNPNTPVQVAVIYHSAFGHTERVAQAIAQGASEAGAAATCVSVADLADADASAWQQLDAAQVLVFGAPTYMGSVSAEFKAFMDSTSKQWFERLWLGKWAAGFTVSGGLSGDKLGVLQQLCIFAMQHGMCWAGLPTLPTGNGDADINRLSSFLGLMCQADDAPSDITPPAGDIKTAELFGKHLAGLVGR